jgi:type IV pilus assembly protein PilN
MRISINLATKPFVELRPLFARLRLVMAALAMTAIALGVALHLLTARAHTAEAEMDALKSKTLAAQIELQTNERRMREPQNQAILTRATFLNDLFARKSFSWTSVMMDLERVLPAGVQVTSIEPSVTPDHDVSIHLRVSGDRDRAVDLIRNLEQSQRFLAPRLANETAQTQEPGKMTNVSQVGVPGGVEFDILSGYNPLPAIAKGPGEKDDAAKGGSVKKSAGDAAKPSSPAHKGAVHAGAKAAGATGTSGKPAAKRGAQ